MIGMFSHLNATQFSFTMLGNQAQLSQHRLLDLERIVRIIPCNVKLNYILVESPPGFRQGAICDVCLKFVPELSDCSEKCNPFG